MTEWHKDRGAQRGRAQGQRGSRIEGHKEGEHKDRGAQGLRGTKRDSTRTEGLKD